MNTKRRLIGGWMGGIRMISTLVLFLAEACSPANLIHTDPRDFLLKGTDLPIEGRYTIPLHERHPISNEMVVYLMGDQAGEKRVQSTGRLLGWRVHFVRGEDVKTGPEDITCVVMQFATPEGARLNLDTYALSKVNPREWQRLDRTLHLGEASLAETRVEPFADGSKMVYFEVNFIQRNVGVRIEVNGMEGQVTLEDGQDLAAVVLAKLGQAELYSEPVPTPTPGFEAPEEGMTIYQ